LKEKKKQKKKLHSCRAVLHSKSITRRHLRSDSFFMHRAMFSKAIQVKRLSVADLEGSCGDSGTNGLKGCFRPKKSDLQHLT
jgi:hypothetical protein